MNQVTLLSASQKTAKLALPIVSSRLVVGINMFIAMLLIARLGHAQLAAGALVTTISTLLLVVAWSVLFSVGPVIGRLYGAGKKDQLGIILRTSWLLGTLIGLPVMYIMWHIGPILHLFHQQERLVVLTQHYFYGLTWSVLPSIWFMCCSQFVVAIEKPRIILIASILRLLLMLIPGYALLFGKFGLPKIGMAGMAYATAFMWWVVFILTIIYLLKNQFKVYKIFVFSEGFSRQYLKKLFSIGYPICIQWGAELAAFSLCAIFVGWINQASLAAWQIVIQLNMIAIMIPFGLAQVSAVLIGQALGRNEKSATRSLGNAGLLIGALSTGFIALLYLFVPKLLIDFYLNIHNPANLTTMHIATLLLTVVAFSQIFDGIRNIATGVLRGFHDTKIPMLVGTTINWLIGIPLGYLFAFKLHWGAVGLSIAFLFAVFIGAVILVQRFYNKSSLCY